MTHHVQLLAEVELYFKRATYMLEALLQRPLEEYYQVFSASYLTASATFVAESGIQTEQAQGVCVAHEQCTGNLYFYSNIHT